MTSSTLLSVTIWPMSRTEPSERQPVVRPLGERDEAHDVHGRVAAAGERVSDRLDVLAGPDEHRAAPVAGRLQDRTGRRLVRVAEEADVGDGEEQRPVEDVVALEVEPVDEREQQRDDRRLEQPGDDAREPRPLVPAGVQARPREQQRADEERERDEVLGLVQRAPDRRAVEHAERPGLDAQRREDREEQAAEVEGQQRRDARQAPQRVHAQDERERRRPLAAHVVRLAADRRRRHEGTARRRSAGRRGTRWCVRSSACAAHVCSSDAQTPPMSRSCGATSASSARKRLDAGLLDGALQAVAQRDLRLPAEEVACARDVGSALLGVVRGQRLVHDLGARARDRDDGLGELEQGELVGVADVDGEVLAGLGERDQAADEVLDVAERARLAARRRRP